MSLFKRLRSPPFTTLGASYAATSPVIHTFSTGEAAIFVNAYVVDTGQGLVVIDSTLTESYSKALKEMVDKLGKPIRAVLITHGHPDHYNGLTNLLAGRKIPVYSTKGTLDVIKLSDAAKENAVEAGIRRGMAGNTHVSNKVVGDGKSVTIDGVRFTAVAIGPAESHADSIWVMKSGDTRVAFVGDLVFNGIHSYLCDGHTTEWLAALDRLAGILTSERITTIYPGHGAAGDATLIDNQRKYLNAFRAGVQTLAGDGNLTDEDKATLQADLERDTNVKGVAFLVHACAVPVANELGFSINKVP